MSRNATSASHIFTCTPLVIKAIHCKEAENISKGNYNTVNTALQSKRSCHVSMQSDELVSKANDDGQATQIENSQQRLPAAPLVF